MKYLHLLTLLILLFNSPFCFSQKGSIHLSLNSGFNYSNVKVIKIEAHYPSEWKASYRYGFGVSYEILNNLQIGLEGNIEEKGWKQDSTGVIDTSSGRFLISEADYYYPFISLPLIAKYSVGFKSIKFFVEGGYLINFRRNGTKIKTTLPGSIPLGEEPIDDEPKIDYGWMYGAGMTINIYNNWFANLSGRYALSHTGVGDWGVQKVNLRHQNYAGLLAVTYRIQPGKNKM